MSQWQFARMHTCAWNSAAAALSLLFAAPRPARDLIYSALLKSMSAEHKFSSAAKLCGEVLAGVADGLLPLQECEEVLRDALCLLASKDIKVTPHCEGYVLCCLARGRVT